MTRGGLPLPREVPTSRSVELSNTGLPEFRCSVSQHNATITRNFKHTTLRPAVVTVHIEGDPARDTGSLADFISVTLAEQWHIKRLPLTKLDDPVCCSGLESKVNFGTRIQFQYKGTDYDRYFDV